MIANRQSESEIKHGIWTGEAPMTDECIILTENGIQKAKSLHHVTLKEKFLISSRISLERRGREFVVSDRDAPGPAAVPDRDLTRKHVRCDREEHWLMRKRARVRERSEQELDCKNDRGAPTANSGDAAGTVTITILQSYCADARTDTKRSERADGFTDANGSTGTMRHYQMKCPRDRW